MDYSQFATATKDLVGRLADRVPMDVREGIDEFADAGELGELISELTAALVAWRITVTAAERDDLRDIIAYTHESIDVLNDLTVVSTRTRPTRAGHRTAF